METLERLRRGEWLARSCLWVCCLPLLAMASEQVSQDKDNAAFDYRERSTMETIRFRSMGEESMANTAIEGGLAAPAEGVPLRADADDDYYLDPLSLQPSDGRTDLGRSEIPVDIRFSNPAIIPGQTRSNNYLIRPPENRTYDTLNTNLVGR